MILITLFLDEERRLEAKIAAHRNAELKYGG